MKTKLKRVSKRTLALILSTLIMLSVVGVGTLINVSAYDTGTLYFTPYSGSEGAGWIKDNKTILARYLPGDNSWQTAEATDTGRTISGKRVYTVDVQNRYGGLDNLYFRAGSSISDYDQTSNEIHPFSSWTTSMWDKYYNGSSWATPSYDTFKLRNNGTDLATFSYSSGLAYTASATLTKGTTYNVNVYDGANYWANGSATALTTTGNNTMYRYDSGGSSDCMTITPSVTGTYTFTWTLNGKGSRDDAGTLAVTYPTTYSISYKKGTYGSGTEYTDTKVKGTAINLRGAIFTRTGYTQTAWASNAAGTTKSKELNASYSTDAALTLYPYWTANKYNITYKDGGNTDFSGTHGSGYPTTHTYGTATTLVNPTKTGYDFGGWYTTSACTGTAVTSLGATTYTSDITLYAKWTKKTYTITYKPGTNGTGSQTTDTKIYGTDLTLKGAIFTRDNYTQTGWSTTDGGTKAYELGGTYSANSATTLYPYWTLSATPQLAAISNVSKTVNDTTFNVSATINNSNYASGTLSVTASSGTTSVATVGTVSKSGDNVTIPLTVKGPGTSTITVTLKDGSTTVDTKTFTVTVATPTFTIADKTIYANSKDVAACTVTNGGTAPSSIAWSSGTTANVTVNSSTGTLTAKKINSSSTITATATYACGYTKSATATVTVANPTLTIQAGATSGVIGTTTTASVASSSNPTVSTTTVDSYAWTTSDSNVVGLSSATATSPTLTFKKAGTATIGLTVTYKNNSLTKTNTNTLTITVTDASITLTSSLVTLNVNGTNTRTATGSTVGSAASTTMEYSGTNEYISVNESTGQVTALKPTSSNQTVTATYTVTCGGQTTTKTATYTVKVNSPTITMAAKTVAKGDSVTFSATTTNPTGLTITYSLKSAVSGVSINSSTGVVTVTSGCTATSATVVATAKNSAGTAVATKEAALTIQAPTVTLTNQNIAQDDTVYATVGTNVTSTASNNFSGSYTVSSSKTSVATVTMNNSKLTITPVAKGKTTITVTATKGSISVTKTFTVKVAAAVTDQLILFTNNYSWSSVYIYYQYNSNGTQTVGLTQMTKIGKNESNQDVYGFNMPIAHYNNLSLLIFASDTSWNNQTVDITSNLTTNSAYYISGDGTGQKARTVGTYTNPISVPQISADDIADLPINTSTSMTADLLNNVTPSSYTWTRSSTSYLTLANASTTSNSNTLTGTYPGTTTITIRAYSPLPENWTFETTDGAAALIAGTATANVTTTATPKSVTWGNKVSTDNGSTYVTTNASGAGTVTVSPTMTNGGTVAHGTQVTFTATTNSGYKFAGWQVNGTNSITSTTTKTVQITENTTVYALYYKTYTVTVTKGTGVTSYKTNHSSYTGTYTSNQTFTVNAGTTLNITNIVYANGYEADSTNSSSLTNSNIQANKTPVIAAKKKTYTLTGEVSGHGSVKFYSDSACTTEITTAQINDTIYAKYISADGYVLKSFAKKSGTGAHAVLGTRSGNVIPITMGYENLTITATAILEYSVTYYVDMHSSSVTSLSAAVVTTSGGSTVQTDSSGAQCSATLSKQGDSSVYAATINTPVTQSGSTYNPVYLKITYNGTSYVNTLISANVQTLAGSTNKEVWLEAANDPTVEKRVATATNTTTSVTSGNKRIYLAKPYDWQTTETAWENIGLYHWGDYADMGWANAYKMHYIGHDSDYHYYYYDIPTAAKYIIFQGWGSNTSFNLQAQTEDIELSTNYYVLSHDGAYKGTAGDNVSVPAYTRYAASATLNKGDTASIAPTTSNTVKYVTSNSSVASVSNSETTAGTVTAEGRGTATITVKVLGTIGSRVYSNNNSNPDMMTYTTSVTVKDPSYFAGFNIMSLESNTSTITIPTVGSSQPGYFDDIAVTVSGLANSGTYTNSAIITSTNKTVSVNGSNVSKPVTYTVKYAKANSTFSGYSAISVTADVVSKSIRYDGANRYGYSEWTITPSGDTAPTATTKVENGVETATTKEITLLGKTYSEVFESYSYVDVTFTFNYYTYKTKRTVFKLDDEGNKIPKRDNEGAIIEGEYETEEKEFYQYDADYIDPDNHGVAGYSTANDAENRNSSNFDASKHESATYTVTDFEIRNKSAAGLANKSQTLTVAEAAAAIADMPDNDYYSYRLNASTIKTPTANGDYKANVTVELLHAPKKYIVKLDGNNVTNGNDGSRNLNTNYYFYQEYATLSSGNNTNWCVSNDEGTSEGTPLANGKSYKFRVAGNTYIKGVAASIADADFNRSKVTNAGQQITHEAKSSTNQTVVEKLTNNFYISDFFVPEFVKNERNVQEDDVKFVGGGVVYYQVKDGVVDSKVEDAGYANSEGVGIKDSLVDFIQEKIESASVPNEIESTDLRKEIAYGTEIAAKADSETGLRYRYLPYNVFTRDNGTLSTGLEDEVSGNVLIQQLGPNNVPVTRTVDGKTVPVYYTLSTQTSSDTFRYSNTLRAYQYIYADKKENKEANAGKNMRLYAYYIYSYTEYDKDTGIPSTVYKVVLSDEYADASTYWNNTNTNN